MQLNNKTALVIGGGQTPGATIGNGRAVSLAFANAGASVVVADRNLQSAEETVTAITDTGGKAIAIQVDVRDEDQVQAAISTTCKHFGGLNILHNNVASPQARGTAMPALSKSKRTTLAF